jgi:hypothetical protein
VSGGGLMRVPVYTDERGRWRDRQGRYAAWPEAPSEPDETCPNGCERFGDWWVPVDCAIHLGVAP